MSCGAGHSGITLVEGVQLGAKGDCSVGVVHIIAGVGLEIRGDVWVDVPELGPRVVREEAVVVANCVVRKRVDLLDYLEKGH